MLDQRRPRTAILATLIVGGCAVALELVLPGAHSSGFEPALYVGLAQLAVGGPALQRQVDVRMEQLPPQTR